MPKSIWRTLMLILAAAAGIGVLLRRRTTTARYDDEDLPREAAQTAAGGGLRLCGNPDSAVFHIEGCRTFNAAPGAPSFATREEAIEAGYRPCGVCRP